jgi:P4 family phage/plasmid primase-like protien
MIIAKALIKYSLGFGDDKYLRYACGWNNNNVRPKIIRDARNLNFFSNEQLDTDDYILNCQNTALRLSQGKVEIVPHGADLMLSQIAEVTYNPDAKCERWERFIDEVMQDDKTKVRYLQKLCGLCLTGDTSLEKMWFLYGNSTRNGKSTLCEVIAKMLGTYATNIKPETLAVKQNNDSRIASPDVAKLAGKRLVLCSEPPKKMLLNTEMLKTITGNDTITARFLHECEFSFKPKFKLLCNTNYLPLVSDNTVFKSERVQVIGFNRHFKPEEQDKTLKTKLSTKNALSGILNWCLQGWLMYCEEGLSEPDSIKATTGEYVSNSDKMQNFIDDCLIEIPSINTSIKECYRVYEEWCRENGYGSENKGNFITEIKAKGIYKASGTVGGRTVRNVIHGYGILDSR